MPGIEVVSGIQKKFSRAAAKCEKCFAAALLCLVFCGFGAYSSNHSLAGKCPLTPEVYGDGNSYAYAGRREACRISHTDWGNAPAN